MESHQKEQIKIIDTIAEQAKNNSIAFSTVAPVADFESDARLALTSAHIPRPDLIAKIQEEIVRPLKAIDPHHYYYSSDSYHISLKNVRVVNDPPHFSPADVETAQNVFSKTVPGHKRFRAFFYRLILFPNNIGLVGTTDPEFDDLLLDLENNLNATRLPDDKKYANSRHFFAAITFVRHSNPSEKYKQKVEELSRTIAFNPYWVDSICLVTCSAIFKKRTVIDTWRLE